MFVLCFIVHSLGTYDITEATLYNDLSNIGRICHSFHFIRGAIVKGSLTSSTYSTNISLMYSPVCSSMYVYDIEEEDTLSDDWSISYTNITITELELSYLSLETSPVSIVIVTTGTCDCLTSN